MTSCTESDDSVRASEKPGAPSEAWFEISISILNQHGAPVSEDAVQVVGITCPGTVFHPIQNPGSGFDARSPIRRLPKTPPEVTLSFSGSKIQTSILRLTAQSTHALKGEVRVYEFQDSLVGRLIGPDGCPKENFTLDLSVVNGSDARFKHHRVTTDPAGVFVVPAVRFPIHWHVDSRIPGIQFDPRPTVPREVETRRTVTVTMTEVGDLRIGLSAKHPEDLLLEVLPLSPIPERLDVPRWNDGAGALSVEAKAQLVSNGEINLGSVPDGRYRITIATRTGLCWTKIITFDGTETLLRAELPETLEQYRYEGVLRTNAPIESGAVLDGYLTPSLIAKILAVRDRQGFTPARLSPSGSFALMRERDSQWLTILVDENVYHLRCNGTSARELELVNDPEDACVSVTVVDTDDGKPIEGLAVNATNLLGGENTQHQHPPSLEVWERLSDSDGGAEITGLTPGFYVLSVAKLEEAPGVGKFRYFREATRVLELPRGASAVVLRVQRRRLQERQ